jgi:deferrochelatase/peroxidase EfeB
VNGPMCPPVLTRRHVIAAATGLAAAASLSRGTSAATVPQAAPDVSDGQIVPFHGEHQAGIITPVQRHTMFAAFDLASAKRDEVADLLRGWTDAAARMTVGQAVAPLDLGSDTASSDSADVLGLPPARLTITFGFGASLFVKDGADRYGIAAKRPEALVDMPHFPGDQLVPARSDGDLSVQACADDAQVAMHAVRELARLAYGKADLRWVQSGFNGGFGGDDTPRNLMGFKDGTNNPPVSDPKVMNAVVWVGDDGPVWMRGGSYVVFRRSRIDLEHWDRMKTGFQEQTFGRQKMSGAPLGKQSERDQPDFAANDADGNPVIPENAHIRLAAAENNDGARILRRAFSYSDGANFVAERWPPWKQGMEFDAGLLFICYQRDPRTGFIKLFERMAKFDMMNQFVTNTASALFACPGGIGEGEFVGQRLFDAA